MRMRPGIGGKLVLRCAYIAVLGTGLARIGAQESTKRLITGCVIVAAVILDHYRHRIRKSQKQVLLSAKAKQ